MTVFAHQIQYAQKAVKQNTDKKKTFLKGLKDQKQRLIFPLFLQGAFTFGAVILLAKGSKLGDTIGFHFTAVNYLFSDQ